MSHSGADVICDLRFKCSSPTRVVRPSLSEAIEEHEWGRGILMPTASGQRIGFEVVPLVWILVIPASLWLSTYRLRRTCFSHENAMLCAKGYSTLQDRWVCQCHDTAVLAAAAATPTESALSSTRLGRALWYLDCMWAESSSISASGPCSWLARSWVGNPQGS